MKKLLLVMLAALLCAPAFAHRAHGGSPTTVYGYDGAISINSSGRLVNGHGNPIQLRGFSMPMDSQIMGSGGDAYGGDWAVNPGGVYFGSTGAPCPLVASFKPNVVRITINADAWFNLPMGVLAGSAASPSWSGTTVPGDPAGVYKQMIYTQIQCDRSIGAYTILDLHWSAAKFTLGGTTHYLGTWGQSPGLDADVGVPFWTAGTGAGPLDYNGNATTGIVQYALTNWTNPANGTINDLIFELFNEPYFNAGINTASYNSASGGGGSTITYQSAMLNGGWVNKWDNQNLTNTGRGGVGVTSALRSADGYFDQWWQIGGYQAALNGIRALGATNVILANTTSFAHTLCDVTSILPTDTLSPSQVGTSYHAYQYGSTNWPYSVNGSCDTGTNGTSSSYNVANSIIAGTLSGLGRALPVVETEYASTNNAGSGATQPDTFMTTVHGWSDGTPTGGSGMVAWQWTLSTSCGSLQQWIENCYPTSGTITATGSMSGSTTMTITAVSGGSLAPGYILTSGCGSANDTTWDRPYIVSQLTGTTGSTGTYQISGAHTCGSGSLTFQTLTPSNGQGLTDYNWMSTHP